MKWTQNEIQNWYKDQKIQRSYMKLVVPAIHELNQDFEVVQYGALSLNPSLYPLYLLKSKKFDANKKNILVTGGVHGYETSGVFGALAFAKHNASAYFSKFNFIVAPCLSPWSFETINRWNPNAIDPNRSFYNNSPSEECQFFLEAMSKLELKFYAHFDLHETTDTDNTVFRPMLEKRDGVVLEESEIPDGFYVVGDSENPQFEFQKAIVQNVKKITHIAPPDAEQKIIGESIQQEGVINYPLKKLSLCAAFSGAIFTTTTEVYPDSPKLNPEICIQAQVAAITGGLDFIAND